MSRARRWPGRIQRFLQVPNKKSKTAQGEVILQVDRLWIQRQAAAETQEIHTNRAHILMRSEKNKTIQENNTGVLLPLKVHGEGQAHPQEASKDLKEPGSWTRGPAPVNEKASKMNHNLSLRGGRGRADLIHASLFRCLSNNKGMDWHEV